jgi:hypothetical protein
VKERKLLVDIVLKKHSGNLNYENFDRQVNNWGFKVRAMERNQQLQC